MSHLRAPCRCCGATFPTLAAWLSLPLVGRMSDGDSGTLELRNCACGTTLAIDAVTIDGPSDALLEDVARVFQAEASEAPESRRGRWLLAQAASMLARRAGRAA